MAVHIPLVQPDGAFIWLDLPSDIDTYPQVVNRNSQCSMCLSHSYCCGNRTLAAQAGIDEDSYIGKRWVEVVAEARAFAADSM